MGGYSNQGEVVIFSAMKQIVVSLVLPFMSGCAIMLASGLPEAHPPEELRVGVDRSWMDGHYGFPIAAGDDGRGANVEQIQFVDGVSKDWKGFRIAAHGSLDYITFCIWEIVGTPLELLSRAIGYPTYVFFVVYSDGIDGKVERIVSRDSDEGRKYANMSWSMPLVTGLRLNDSPNVRNGVIERLMTTEDVVVSSEDATTGDDKSLYSIVSLDRESGSDFAYRFVLEVLGASNLKTYRIIQKEFRKEIQEDYLETYKSSDADCLHIDFTEFKLAEGGRIAGQAVIISVTPIAVLDYDPNTRKGKITVRFNNAAGTEVARTWAKKNIEAIVQDKNIVLTTGTNPPRGKYVSLGEVWRENVLEIEFKTQ